MKRLLFLSPFLAFSLLAAEPDNQAHPDQVVERWNAEFLAAVRRQAPPPCLVARNLAILHLAIWRGVATAKHGEESQAVAGAAHQVCVTLFSGDRVGFDNLLKAFSARGVAFASAKAAADEVLQEREGDGSNTTVHYDPKLGAGVWERTTNNRAPELPHWGMVKPFVLKSAAEFRPLPPPDLGSVAYAHEVNEVRELGGLKSERRTADQTQIGQFWADFSYTSCPAGRWNEIVCQILQKNGMSVRDKAQLFAILNVAMADAGIAGWECKYHYRFWRPVSAIHETHDDGNKSTQPDPAWASLLPSPSHPDYVSGHSVFGGAAAWVLTQSLGVPKQRISVTSREMPGVTRTFANYEEIAQEAGRSRVYAGIHFPSACEQGIVLGTKVAKQVMKQFEEIGSQSPTVP